MAGFINNAFRSAVNAFSSSGNGNNNANNDSSAPGDGSAITSSFSISSNDQGQTSEQAVVTTSASPQVSTSSAVAEASFTSNPFLRLLKTPVSIFTRFGGGDIPGPFPAEASTTSSWSPLPGLVKKRKRMEDSNVQSARRVFKRMKVDDAANDVEMNDTDSETGGFDCEEPVESVERVVKYRKPTVESDYDAESEPSSNLESDSSVDSSADELEDDRGGEAGDEDENEGLNDSDAENVAPSDGEEYEIEDEYDGSEVDADQSSSGRTEYDDVDMEGTEYDETDFERSDNEGNDSGSQIEDEEMEDVSDEPESHRLSTTFPSAITRDNVFTNVADVDTTGWSPADVTLFTTLARRGNEPLMPEEWSKQLPGLPYSLFTTTQTPFIKPLKNVSSLCILHLKILLQCGHSTRQRIQNRNSHPEHKIHRAIRLCYKWSLGDAKLNPTERAFVPVLEVVVARKNQTGEELHALMSLKLAKLERHWASALQVKTASEVANVVPGLYGIILVGSTAMLASYVRAPDSENRPDGGIGYGTIRTLALLEWKHKRHDLWNGFALMIMVVHCRNVLVKAVADGGELVGCGPYPEQDE